MLLSVFMSKVIDEGVRPEDIALSDSYIFHEGESMVVHYNKGANKDFVVLSNPDAYEDTEVSVSDMKIFWGGDAFITSGYV